MKLIENNFFILYKTLIWASKHLNRNQSTLCIPCSNILTAVLYEAFVHFPILYSLYTEKGGLSIFFFYGIQMGII